MRKINCKYCDKLIRARSTLRWVQHLRGCERASDEVKLCFKNKKKRSSECSSSQTSQSSEHSVFNLGSLLIELC